jgi:hypothetical protein
MSRRRRELVGLPAGPACCFLCCQTWPPPAPAPAANAARAPQCASRLGGGGPAAAALRTRARARETRGSRAAAAAALRAHEPSPSARSLPRTRAIRGRCAPVGGQARSRKGAIRGREIAVRAAPPRAGRRQSRRATGCLRGARFTHTQKQSRARTRPRFFGADSLSSLSRRRPRRDRRRPGREREASGHARGGEEHPSRV